MRRKGKCKMTAVWEDGAITVEFDGDFGVFSPREVARVSRTANRRRKQMVAGVLREQRIKGRRNERRGQKQGTGEEARQSNGESDEISRLAGEILRGDSELSSGNVGAE